MLLGHRLVLGIAFSSFDMILAENFTISFNPKNGFSQYRKSKIKLNPSVRKQILKELPFGATVQLITGKAYNYPDAMKNRGVGFKVMDKNAKRMIVDFDGQIRHVCYFNLTCEAIETTIAVRLKLNGVKTLPEYDDDSLPF